MPLSTLVKRAIFVAQLLKLHRISLGSSLIYKDCLCVSLRPFLIEESFVCHFTLFFISLSKTYEDDPLYHYKIMKNGSEYTFYGFRTTMWK